MPRDPEAAAHAGRSNDSALLERLRSGDEAAFEDLVGTLHGRLLGFARLFVSSPASAEEVVQDAWLAVIRSLPAFEGRSSLKTWIYSVVANRARTRAQRDGRYVPLDPSPGEGDDESGPGAERFGPDGRWAFPPSPSLLRTPEEILLSGETRGVLERALAELPPGPRAVVALRDVEGLDAEQACNVLGLTETNQRVLLHRGRSRLRKRLEEHLGRK
jgi:RNA polymerase sigma-70 factor (ECF subfamily)